MNRFVTLLCILLSQWCTFALKSPLSRQSTNLRATTRLAVSPQQTVVVTGLGVVSPCGNTVSQFFDNICSGNSAVQVLDRFDPSRFKCQIAAQVRDFDPKQYYQSKKKIKQNDLSCHYAIAASYMALEDAGIKFSAEGNIVNPARVGVVVGSAFGGMDTFEKAALDLEKYGPSAIGPYTIPMILGNTPAGIVAMETGKFYNATNVLML